MIKVNKLSKKTPTEWFWLIWKKRTLSQISFLINCSVNMLLISILGLDRAWWTRPVIFCTRYVWLYGWPLNPGWEDHIHISQQWVLADFASLTCVVPLWDGDVSGDGRAALDDSREGEVAPPWPDKHIRLGLCAVLLLDPVFVSLWPLNKEALDVHCDFWAINTLRTTGGHVRWEKLNLRFITAIFRGKTKKRFTGVHNSVTWRLLGSNSCFIVLHTSRVTNGPEESMKTECWCKRETHQSMLQKSKLTKKIIEDPPK